MRSKLILSVLLIVVVFAACKKTKSGTTNSTADCQACAYTPSCVGTTYAYVDSFIGSTSSTRTITYTAAIDTTIGGVVYQKLVTPTGSSYFNCTNGTSTTIAYNVTSVSGTVTLAAIKLVPLKAAAAVGTTWVDSLTNPANEVVGYYYTLAEKGISKTVNGVSFSNVIHVNVQDSVDLGPGFGNIGTGSTDYYYSQGVGLIEEDTYEFGSPFEVTYLQSYKLP